MPKRVAFTVALLLSLAVHIDRSMTTGGMPLLASLQMVLPDAFILLGGLSVSCAERVLGLPREGYRLIVLLSLLFWFFPISRTLRWAGVYNPFKDGDSSKSWLLSFLAFVLDEADKRLFGRQRTGGWA